MDSELNQYVLPKYIILEGQNLKRAAPAEKAKRFKNKIIYQCINLRVEDKEKKCPYEIELTSHDLQPVYDSAGNVRVHNHGPADAYYFQKKGEKMWSGVLRDNFLTDIHGHLMRRVNGWLFCSMCQVKIKDDGKFTYNETNFHTCREKPLIWDNLTDENGLVHGSFRHLEDEENKMPQWEGQVALICDSSTFGNEPLDSFFIKSDKMSANRTGKERELSKEYDTQRRKEQAPGPSGLRSVPKESVPPPLISLETTKTETHIVAQESAYGGGDSCQKKKKAVEDRNQDRSEGGVIEDKARKECATSSTTFVSPLNAAQTYDIVEDDVGASSNQTPLTAPVGDGSETISPIRLDSHEGAHYVVEDDSDAEDFFETYPNHKSWLFPKGWLIKFLRGEYGPIPTDIIRKYLRYQNIEVPCNATRLTMILLAHYHVEDKLGRTIDLSPLCQRCWSVPSCPEGCREHPIFCTACNLENSRGKGERFCLICDFRKNPPSEFKEYIRIWQQGQKKSFRSIRGNRDLCWLVVPNVKIPSLDSEETKNLADDLMQGNIEGLVSIPSHLDVFSNICWLNNWHPSLIDFKDTNVKARMVCGVIRSRMPYLCRGCFEEPRATVHACGHSKFGGHCLRVNNAKCAEPACKINAMVEGLTAVNHLLM